ncbi:MAG: carbohydrate binding family 9 domain-containing protein, partial [Cyclobacteriaceae bacterium]|nr:carbohydrate binding family 9 domain-containing protein [Cyclobacteriaceae bacterium]
MNRIKIVLILLSILTFSNVFAQVNSEAYQLSVKKTSENIVIDGKLNESVWSEAEKATDFIQNFPTDTLPATSQTEVSMTFNDQFLYVAGKCYENSDKKHIIQSLKRDFSWPLNENFGIYFDPFNDFTNGFTFGISPAGVQREGLVTNGEEVSADWDNKWYSAVSDEGEYWTFEFAIPFKSIRYNPESRSWNMTFLRLDLKNNERSTWSPVPQGYRPSLTFAGKINFEDELPKAGVNVSFIPFVTSGVSRNYEEGEPEVYNFDAGFDAKVALSSSLNLDLTYNPDFSQVEVDQQVTNLNRFEIFFPERRQFFLENSDLFGVNGFRSSRPFFSRRIGIAGNNVTVNGTEDFVSGQVPIQYGARLSGKIGNNWRIGMLNMMTKESEELGLPKQMYSVAVAQRKIFSRSNIGFIVVNKNSFDISIADTARYYYNSSLFKEKDIPQANDSLYVNDFNTVFGSDFAFRSSNNKWSSNIFYHRSLSPNGKN